MIASHTWLVPERYLSARVDDDHSNADVGALRNLDHVLRMRGPALARLRDRLVPRVPRTGKEERSSATRDCHRIPSARVIAQRLLEVTHGAIGVNPHATQVKPS